MLVTNADADPTAYVFHTSEKATKVVITTGGSRSRGKISDIAMGSTVRVWTDGGVAESDPPQASAEAIEIIR